MSNGAGRRVCVWSCDGERVLLLSWIVIMMPDMQPFFANTDTLWTGGINGNDRVHIETRPYYDYRDDYRDSYRNDSCDKSN